MDRKELIVFNKERLREVFQERYGEIFDIDELDNRYVNLLDEDILNRRQISEVHQFLIVKKAYKNLGIDWNSLETGKHILTEKEGLVEVSVSKEGVKHINHLPVDIEISRRRTRNLLRNHLEDALTYNGKKVRRSSKKKEALDRIRYRLMDIFSDLFIFLTSLVLVITYIYMCLNYGWIAFFLTLGIMFILFSDDGYWLMKNYWDKIEQNKIEKDRKMFRRTETISFGSAKYKVLFGAQQKGDPDTFKRAIKELKSGRKCGHWIWYILPQLSYLGNSRKSKLYGIKNLQEAKDYYSAAVIGSRYRDVVKIIEEQLDNPEMTLEKLMGSELDAKKTISSLTLFGQAGCKEANSLLNNQLGGPCKLTLGLLENENLDLFSDWR